PQLDSLALHDALPISYPPELCAEAVRVVRESGKPMKVIAQDLGIALESLRKWVRQAEIDAGEREGLTTQEREELQRLRREVKILDRKSTRLNSGHVKI